ncbi:carboxylesterase/lipase family protein [Streptomyces sp. NPDC057363]|uniref:carboxylesterase/lipase family protein n=1 Tax=Streptomyces sp. NPDC057363 TaxID=3346107 RepID=UPI003641DF63
MSSESRVVSTVHGPVRGDCRPDGNMCFLGIPYARAPIGDLRFAAPVPPEAWTAVRDATAYGPTAKRRIGAASTTIPEPTVPGDGILNLNVFTPDTAPDRPLPVLVWIHGGGFVEGSPASPWYDGAAFNRDGVIVVSVGYRLGVEGFLHLDDAPANRGVLDWIAALEWVRDNIALFGGDPAKVSVAGQSAGGGAALALLTAPAARGLFRAVISASGALMRPDGPDVARTAARLFTARTGMPTTAAALRDLDDGTLLDLQERFLAPGPDREGLPLLLTIGPFADGEVIPRPVFTALTEDDAGADIPLLLGCTTQEFNTVPTLPGTPPPGPLLRNLGLSPERAESAARVYAESATEGYFGQILTDCLFRAPTAEVADARARRGRPTWLYEFDWKSPATGLASHCVDVPFAFDALGAEGVEAALGAAPPQDLADAVHRAWVNFVRSLDPGEEWPDHAVDERTAMVWSGASRPMPDPLASVRALWSV